jgi:hypothetical protein
MISYLTTCGKSALRRRQKAPESYRNPRRFQTAVWDLVWRNETLGADPRLALARVLDLSPGGIQVREGGGADGLAKANTVPIPRPSNPHPNTEAQSSNGEPGSPAGDN